MPRRIISQIHSTVMQTFLNLTEQPIIVCDHRCEVLDFNPQAAAIFPDLVSGCLLSPLIMDSVLLKSWLSEVRSSLCLDIIEIASDIAGPIHRSILWKIQAIYSAADAFEGFFLLGTDFTQKEILENELRKSIQLVQDHKMALDVSSIVAITDSRGVIQYVNDRFCLISGYERHELIGRTHAIVQSHYHPPEFFRQLWVTIARGKVWKGEIKNKAKDGSYYWADTTIVPFRDEKGRPYQYMAIRNDISQSKLLQESIESERIRVLHAEKMASLGELAAGIAHELGNPAASINAWLDVIESQRERAGLDVEFFVRMIPKVRRDANRIRDIIRNMLAYARDGSKDPFRLENPLLLLNQVLDNCSYKLKKAGITTKLVIANPYLSLECRSTEISQLFINFILNACDAIQDLPEKWIEIEVLDKDPRIEFLITDSGTGIDPDLFEKIFKPFFTTKAAGVGTGLGLSIAKSIAENHQGSVDIDRSSPHTRFVISLPKRLIPLEEEARDPEDER